MNRCGYYLGMLALAGGTAAVGYDAGSGFDRGQFRASRYSFEEAAEAARWPADRSKAEISDLHFKHGARSLKWDYRPGATLTVDDPAGIAAINSDPNNGGLKFWIYQEKPQRGTLRIEGGTPAGLKAGRPRCRFDVRLNFTGWRAIWVGIKADFKMLDDKQPLEMLRLAADTRSAGTLWIDRVELINYIYWAREADRQVSINVRQKGGPNQTEQRFNRKFPVDRKPPTEAELAALPVISERMRNWISGSGEAGRRPETARMQEKLIASVPAALKKFDAFNIRRHPDGRITGNPVFTVIHGGRPSLQELFDQCVLPLALVWNYPGTEEKPNPYFRSDALRERILLAFDHANDQGWAAGSGMGTSYGIHLGLSGYILTIFLMRPELETAGILAREVETSQYYTGFRDIYRDEVKLAGDGGADTIRTLALFQLIGIVSMPDAAQQVVLMRRYAHWLDRVLTVARGLNPFIKPDGTVYHHGAAYWTGYGNHALDMAARLAYWLRETPFALPEASRNNLKKALLVSRFVAQKYDLASPLNGRWPFWKDALVPTVAGFAYAAMLTPEPDRELAAAFNRLYDPAYPGIREKFGEVKYQGNTFTSTVGNCEDVLSFAERFREIPAESDPQGNLALPFAGASFHRRGRTLVTVKGNSRYIWDYESQAENQLGRNLSRGAIFILNAGEPVNLAAGGFAWEGWDWARIPGTTTVAQSFAEMDPALNKDASRHFTDQGAVGGMAFGENGVFMMRFHDTTYDPSFRADKSVFCFGDLVVALGSGIVNGDAEHPTETTLFQRRLPSPETATTVNGEAVTALPFERQEPGALELVDSAGIRYRVPDGSRVRVLRRRQEFPSEKHGRKTGGAGDFEVAVIEHGRAPKDAGYEYSILLNGVADRPEYEVLARRGNVHAVRFPGKADVLAVFAAGPVGCGGVTAVDSPALLALEPAGGRAVKLTAAMPDFGRAWLPQPKKITLNPEPYNLRNRPDFLTVTLAGRWTRRDGKPVRSDGGATVLRLPVADGAAQSVELLPEAE